MSQYADHYFDENSRNNSWANMLVFIPHGARVLDVGCATANFGQWLEQHRGCEVVGVDINAEDILEAQTKISAAFILDVTDPTALQTLGTFDVIVFADVLEHLVDPRAALRACKGLLKDGGSVVYSIPHMGHISVRFNVLEGRFPYAELGLLDRTHLHFYDRVEVDSLFAGAGFSIVEQNPTVVGFPERLTTQRLAAVGLHDSPHFHAMLSATEADLYQFIGRAVPTRDVPVVARDVPDDDASPDGLLFLANAVLDENERLRGELAALQAVQELTEAHANRVQRRIRSVVDRLRRGSGLTRGD